MPRLIPRIAVVRNISCRLSRARCGLRRSEAAEGAGKGAPRTRDVDRIAAPYPHPSWSSDGKSIAFVGYTPVPMDFPSIKRVGADGSGEASEVTFAIDPSWSSGGRWIGYTDNGNRSLPTELRAIHPDGSGDRLIAGVRSTGVFSPAWSAMGKSLLFVAFPPTAARPAHSAARSGPRPRATRRPPARAELPVRSRRARSHPRQSANRSHPRARRQRRRRRPRRRPRRRRLRRRLRQRPRRSLGPCRSRLRARRPRRPGERARRGRLQQRGIRLRRRGGTGRTRVRGPPSAGPARSD